MAKSVDPLPRLDRLCAGMVAAEAAYREELARIPADKRVSGENLVHYLHMRSEDYRELQGALSAYGLSSLGRCEGAVLTHCKRVRAALACIQKGEPWVVDDRRVLLENAGMEAAAQRLFGQSSPRIMVTLAATDADDPAKLDSLLRAGMGVARINAGHDQPAKWSALIAAVREASRRTTVPCRVLLDLPGIKLRVGDLPSLPGLLVLRPERDGTDQVVAPASCPLRLSAGGEGGLPIVGLTADDCQDGDRLRLRDSRGRKRTLRVTTDDEGHLVVSSRRTVRIAEGMRITVRRKGHKVASGTVQGLPPQPCAIPVTNGGHIILVRPGSRGAGSCSPRTGLWRIPCTLPSILGEIQKGHRIRFNDGRFGGVVDATGTGWVRLHFDHVPNGKAKLKADQGINCIDTVIDVPALLADDAAIIDGFAAVVDMLGVSFVQNAHQIRKVRERCAAVQAAPGLVAKIETTAGFTHIADILLEGLVGNSFAVMVARGDLAVEVGFARMAEIQEELLWLCEAAHIPVIWGTQVLETLVKKGLPSRAEVTDAAMSSRAECVMLNKGPYVADAVRFLVDVVPRIRDHVVKKRSMLRRLQVAQDPSERRQPEGG